MFFDRLSRKSALISEAIATKHNIGESLNSVVSEQLVHICEVLLTAIISTLVLGV